MKRFGLRHVLLEVTLFASAFGLFRLADEVNFHLTGVFVFGSAAILGAALGGLSGKPVAMAIGAAALPALMWVLLWVVLIWWVNPN